MADATDSERSRWRTFGERTIYDNEWVWLGQGDVEMPNGERFWHHVVRLPRAAVMVLVDDQDRVLMMWRHRFVRDRWGWELPGGLIDAGEEPEQTAIREPEEETGYRAGRVEHLAAYEPMVGMVTSEHAVFIGRDPEKIGEPVEVTEADRIEWVPLASVPELIASGQIWNSGFGTAGFTPHDFRRLLATDLVNNGLPIHIGAALLGHLNLETTRGYVKPREFA